MTRAKKTATTYLPPVNIKRLDPSILETPEYMPDRRNPATTLLSSLVIAGRGIHLGTGEAATVLQVLSGVALQDYHADTALDVVRNALEALASGDDTHLHDECYEVATVNGALCKLIHDIQHTLEPVWKRLPEDVCSAVEDKVCDFINEYGGDDCEPFTFLDAPRWPCIDDVSEERDSLACDVKDLETRIADLCDENARLLTACEGKGIELTATPEPTSVQALREEVKALRQAMSEATTARIRAEDERDLHARALEAVKEERAAAMETATRLEGERDAATYAFRIACEERDALREELAQAQAERDAHNRELDRLHAQRQPEAVAVSEAAPARTPEQAIEAYRVARAAIDSRNPAACRRALAGLPVWPSQKKADLTARLNAILTVS